MMSLRLVPTFIRRVIATGFVVFAGNMVWAEDASAALQSVIGHIDGRCPQELASFRQNAIADKDLLERFAASADASPDATPSDIPVGIWSATAYAVVDNAMFTFDAHKMPADKRGKVTASLQSSVSLMRCLQPSEAEWAAFTAARPNREDATAELQNGRCLLPWADNILGLLNGDLNGDALRDALAGAKKYDLSLCEKKG